MKEKNLIRALLVFEKEDSYPIEFLLLKAFLEKVSKTFPQVSIFYNLERNDEILKKIEEPNLKKNLHRLQSIEGHETSLSLIACLQEVSKKMLQADEDTLALCCTWYPLLEGELSNQALDVHTQSLAHYTFGENIPLGLVPEYLSKDFISTLPLHAPNSILEFRSFVIKNIEQYDVEIFYESPDLRQYRLDFSSQTPRSQKVAKQVLQWKPSLKYKELDDLIKKHPSILRPFYSYFELEVSVDMSSSAFHPFYWPSKKFSQRTSEKTKETLESEGKLHIKKELIEKLKNEIENYGLEKGSAIALGGLGEPLEHPDFFTILNSFAELQNVHTIFIESFGIKMNEIFFEKLKEIPHPEKIQIIIRLSTLQKERYEKFYNSKDWNILNQNISLWESVTAYKIFIECLRIQENDDEIEEFMKRFDSTSLSVILQKYNSYANTLPERRVANFNPLHRNFCWHLARDFYMNVHGQVPICKQDPFAIHGNCIDYSHSSLNEILEKTEIYLRASLNENYEKIQMPCMQCDEWYTFNA